MTRYYKEKNLNKGEVHLIKVDDHDKGTLKLLRITDTMYSTSVEIETLVHNRNEKHFFHDKAEFSATKKEVFDKNFKLINDKFKKLWKK